MLSGAMGMTKHTNTSSAHCALTRPSKMNNKMTNFRINGKHMKKHKKYLNISILPISSFWHDINK
jgi:hypothetical protein